MAVRYHYTHTEDNVPIATMEASCIGGLEVPPLVEEDIEFWTDCLAEWIGMWLRNSPQFMEVQQQKMIRTALYPFLFGVSNNLPRAWIEVLHSYGIFEKDREKKTTSLSEAELEMLEMAEVIFTRCSQLVRNKNDLKTIMNFIYEVEERSSLLASIDITYALQEVANLQVFKSMWAPIRRTYQKKKPQAHVCIVYFFKTISHHIEYYGRDAVDKADEIKKAAQERIRAKRETSSGKDGISEGNLAFSKENYLEAIQIYSRAIEKDPFNSVLYSNRAQAYINLGDARSGLCDSKRAILLDPSNSKHPFRAAKAYFNLGQLDKAEELNQQADRSAEPVQRGFIEQQRIAIEEAKMKIRPNMMEEKENKPPEFGSVTQMEFRRRLCEGSSARASNLYSRAVERFQQALDMIGRPGSEMIQVDKEDYVVLLHALGTSCVKSGGLYNLQTAMSKFNIILEETNNFPAVFWGLGKAYQSLNRFDEAVSVLKQGLKRVKELKVSGDHHIYLWPQSNERIAETDLRELEKLMTVLLEKCKHPPKPDAYCKFHSDLENSKKEIYTTDPDFKGYIRLKCRAKCHLEFHIPCWKTFGHNIAIKHIGKDMLDTPCPTPDCWGLIKVVEMYRPDMEKPVEWISPTEPTKPPPNTKTKMETTNPNKIQRKQEKKRLRKARRKEAAMKKCEMEEAQRDAEEEEISAPVTVNQSSLLDKEANVDTRIGRVLEKEKEEVFCGGKTKVAKAKKKEKKPKQFLQMKVEFNEEEKERYSARSLDEDGDYISLPPVSRSILDPPETGAQAAPPRFGMAQIFDALGQRLYQFFSQYIGRGPVDLLSEKAQIDILQKLASEGQERIHDMGGIANFLQYNPEFKVVNGQMAYFRGVQDVPSALPEPVQSRGLHEVHVSSEHLQQQEHIGDDMIKSAHVLNPAAKEFFPPPSKTSSSSETADPATTTTTTGEDTPTTGEEDDISLQTEAVNSSTASTDDFIPVLNSKKAGPVLRMNPLPCSTTANRFAVLGSPSTSPVKQISQCKINAGSTSSWQKNHGGSRLKAPADLPIPPPKQLRTSPDISDVSGDEAPRSSSSTASSSGHGGMADVSGQNSTTDDTSVSVDKPKPLVAARVRIPSRGRKKFNRTRLTGSTSQLDSSLTSSELKEEGETESVTSTQSDRGSIEEETGVKQQLDESHAATADEKPQIKVPTVDQPPAPRAIEPYPSSAEEPFSPPADRPVMTVKELVPPSGDPLSRDTDTENLLSGMSQAESLGSMSWSMEDAVPVPWPKDNPWDYKPPDSVEPMGAHTGKVKHNQCEITKLTTFQLPSPRKATTGSRVLDHIAAQANWNSPATAAPTVVSSKERMPVNAYASASDVEGVPEDIDTSGLIDPFNGNAVPLDRSSPLPRNGYSSVQWDQLTEYRNDQLWTGLVPPQQQLQSHQPQSGHFTDYPNFTATRGLNEELAWSTENTPRRRLFGDGMPRAREESLPTFALHSLGPYNMGQSSASSDLTGSVGVPNHLALANPSPRGLNHHATHDASLNSPNPTALTDPTASSLDGRGHDNPGFSRTPGKPPRVPQAFNGLSSTSQSFSSRSSSINLSTSSDQAVQAVAGSNTADTNTEMTGPHLDFILDRVASLEKEVDEKRSCLGCAHQELASMQAMCTRLQSERGTRDREFDRLQGELKDKTQQLAVTQSLQPMVDKLVKENEELSVELQLVKEIQQLGPGGEAQTMVNSLRSSLQRTKIQVINSSAKLAVCTLDMAVEKADFHLREINSRMARASSSVPPFVLELRENMKTYMQQCNQLKRQALVERESKLEQLKNGVDPDQVSPVDICSPSFPQPPTQAEKSGTPSSNASSQSMDDEDRKIDSGTADGTAEQLASNSSSIGPIVSTNSLAATSSSIGTESANPNISVIEGERKSGRDLTSAAVPLTSGLMATKSFPLTNPTGSQYSESSIIPMPLKTPISLPKNKPSNPQVSGISQGASSTRIFPRTTAQSTFDKIVATVQETFPNRTRGQIQRVVEELRKQNRGSLTGVSPAQLTHAVIEWIIEEQTADKPSGVDQALAAQSAHPENDAVCSICHEDLNLAPAQTLECHHRFHEECIRKWLDVEHSCPNCRTHVLLLEEFPSLY